MRYTEGRLMTSGLTLHNITFLFINSIIWNAYFELTLSDRGLVSLFFFQRSLNRIQSNNINKQILGV